MRNPSITQYNQLAKTIHWLVVAFILGQWMIAEVAESTDSQMLSLGLIALHKSLGMTVLLLAIIRLAVRMLSDQPAYPSTMTTWQKRAASGTHGALYGLLFALPLSGWLGSSASAYSVSWFNLFSFPDFVKPDDTLKDFFFAIHEWSWRLLCLLVVIHVAAALKHQFFNKNGVLTQMSSRISLLAAAITICVIGFFTYKLQEEKNIQQASDPVSLSNNSSGKDLFSSITAANAWNVDYANSNLKFEAEQAGANFSGEFSQWRTRIVFDPDMPSKGRIETEIELASVDTKDQERDETLATEAFFATSLFPVARFTTSNFELDSVTKKIKSRSTLEIKGRPFPVDFEFEITESESNKTLIGLARLDRLQLMIGTGEWLDTTWIGQYVDVHVVVSSLGK